MSAVVTASTALRQVQRGWPGPSRSQDSPQLWSRSGYIHTAAAEAGAGSLELTLVLAAAEAAGAAAAEHAPPIKQARNAKGCLGKGGAKR